MDMEPVDIVDPRKSIQSENPKKSMQPKPTDFDHFLPWVCRELSLDIDVIVIRATQRMYASGASARSKKTKRKASTLTSITALDADSDEYGSLDKSILINAEYIVRIETVYDANECLVQLKLLKNKDITRQVMKSISLAIPYQKHLYSIIINSGLCKESLYELSKFLPNSHISELCLDSTFVKEANYHLLLTNTNLKHLSLAKCMLNDAVVKTIAEQLKEPRPASKALCALNLSTNRITDVGAKYLADMLRTNRKLSYLNLAGNMITDEGGMRILDTLHEFPLLPLELIESRVRFTAYLRKKNDLIKKLIIELQAAKFDKSPKKKINKKGKIETHSLHVLTEKSRVEIGVEAQITHKKAEYLANQKLGLFNELFSSNNTRTKDAVVYSYGNNILCYLNFAYNNLSYPSLKKLHEVLSTQKSRNRTPIGLIKVVIEGNFMPVACKEFVEIDRILSSFRRNSEGTTKKKAQSSKPAAK